MNGHGDSIFDRKFCELTANPLRPFASLLAQEGLDARFGSP
jgi:hypothetical protein